MPWSDEERGLLDKIRGVDPVTAIKKQVEQGVRKGLQSYVGMPDTKQNRLQAEYYVKNVCAKYMEQNADILQGQDINIKLTF